VISEEKRQVLDYFAQGRRFYKLMQFEEARKMFARALDIDPEDGPSKVYYARCKHYVETPPPEDWDGVFVMKTK
jgi:tetratricopeptide (TPR) repeat protein